MMRVDSKAIKKRVYEKFGWKMTFWAKRRGFTQWQVYDFFRGKAGRDTSRRLVEALRRDGVLVDRDN